MSSTLTEKSKALIRLILDSQVGVTELKGAPGPKTSASIREAHNEVGYPLRREDVLYQKAKAEWNS